MFTNVEYLEFMWPMRHYLITCGDIKNKSNIIALSFCMPVSNEPPLAAIAVGEKSLSYNFINKYKEFIINVPLNNLKSKIYFCGMHSGNDMDKFKETGLTPMQAKIVKAPIIKECKAFMECRVIDKIKTGDKYTFIGRVAEAYAESSALKIKESLDFAQGVFPVKIYGKRFK